MYATPIRWSGFKSALLLLLLYVHTVAPACVKASYLPFCQDLRTALEP